MKVRCMSKMVELDAAVQFEDSEYSSIRRDHKKRRLLRKSRIIFLQIFAKGREYTYMIILANFSFQAPIKRYKIFKNLLEFYHIFMQKKQKYKQEKHSRNQGRKRQP